MALSLLTLGYAIVAFIAGIVALAMPCCFSVLVPSYFAQSFLRRTRLIGMTLVFSAGIATIMLPIALGVAAISQASRVNHSLFFVAGGFFMIILGFWTLWGEGMLPQLNLPAKLNRNDAPSVYVLGVFSGVATSCCAPVLAGILVLTALSATMVEGVLVGLAYVLGMTTPLLLGSMLWDRYAERGSNLLSGRVITFKVLGREVSIHSSKLISGVMFISMGATTVVLGLLGRMIPAPGSDMVGLWQSQTNTLIVNSFANPSNQIGILAILSGIIIVAAVYLARRQRNRAEAPPRQA